MIRSGEVAGSVLRDLQKLSLRSGQAIETDTSSAPYAKQHLQWPVW